jgi:hypothetical protein
MRLAPNPKVIARRLQQRWEVTPVWHVVFAQPGALAQSRAARSQDDAIRTACELHDQSFEVRRIIRPDGTFIERCELDARFEDSGYRRHYRPDDSEEIAVRRQVTLFSLVAPICRA